MDVKVQVSQLIEELIGEIYETRIEQRPAGGFQSVALYGTGGIFDSLQLVNFLMGLEERLADRLNLTLTLTSDRAVSRKVSPFRSTAHLADFILEEIERQKKGEELPAEAAV